MTPTETATILRQYREWLCDTPKSVRPHTRQINEAIDAAVEMIDRLEAAEKDIALKESVIDSLGSELNAVANERDELRAKIEAMEKQEPVAKVRVHRTGGNAGLAWSVAPLNDFDSLPLMRDGDRLYATPCAQTQGEEK